MNALVDTSVWSLALRHHLRHLGAVERSVTDELNALIQEGRARIIGLVRQELLSGIKASSQYEKLRETLRAFPDERIEIEDYEAAAKASNDCRSRGITVSVVDVLICEVARARRWSVFTTDPDFANYAKIFPIQLHTPRR